MTSLTPPFRAISRLPFARVLVILAVVMPLLSSVASAAVTTPASFQRAIVWLDRKHLAHAPLRVGRSEAHALGAGEVNAQVSHSETLLMQALLDDAWTDLFRSRVVRQVCLKLLNADPYIIHSVWGISLERAQRLAADCRAEENRELVIDLFRDRNELRYSDSATLWPRRLVLWRYSASQAEDPGLSFLLLNGSVQHHFLSGAAIAAAGAEALAKEYEQLLRALAFQSVGVYFDALLTNSLAEFAEDSLGPLEAAEDLYLVEANPLARLSFAVARARRVENQILAEIKSEPLPERAARNCVEQFAEDARSAFPILGVQLGQSANYMVGVLARYENIPLDERISMIFTIDYLARSIVRGHTHFEQGVLGAIGGPYIGHVATLFQPQAHARQFIAENFSVIGERLYRFSSLLGLLGNSPPADPLPSFVANNRCEQLSRPRLDGTLGRGRPVVPWVR